MTKLATAWLNRNLKSSLRGVEILWKNKEKPIHEVEELLRKEVKEDYALNECLYLLHNKEAYEMYLTLYGTVRNNLQSYQQLRTLFKTSEMSQKTL